jgi:hypothetical protein
MMLLVLALAASSVSGQTIDSAAVEANPYLETRDKEVSDLVIASVDTTCAASAASGDVDVTAARDELLSALGGENIMLNILTEAENQEDVTKKVEEQVQVSWLISIAFPIVLAILVVVAYLLCCWTGCPCCRCCRCCAKQRDSGIVGKSIFAALVLASGLGILVGGGLTISGFDSCMGGFDSMSCSSATLLNTVLNGETTPYFYGMIPVFETIDTLDQQFNDNSDLMEDIDKLLANTSEIQDAVTVSGTVVNLLAEMLAMSGNVEPASSSGQDLLHKCEFCEQLAAPLQAISDKLNEGVGSALAEARSGVKEVLSKEKRQELQTTLRAASEPLVSFKDSMRDTFAGFVEPGTFETIQETLKAYVQPALLIFFFLAILLFLFACLSTSCWIAREKTADGSYNRHPHRLACCVWGCAPFLIFPVMLIGGLLTAISVPLSGVCLTMADLDSQMLYDISPAVGMNMSGDNGIMLASMVENCIATTDPNLNANMMDLVFERDAAGNQVYVRDKLISTVKDPLDQAFSGLDSNTSATSLSTLPELVALRNVLASNPLDALLLPDFQKLSAEADYAAMLGDSNLQVAAETSSTCTNHPVVGDLGDFTGKTIKGMENFVSKLSDYGSNPSPASGSCLKTVTCDGGATLPACQAGNKFVELLRILTENPAGIFRCDLFQDELGNTCDPINMFKDGAGNWQNDCLVSSGGERVLKTKEEYCDLEDFVKYVQDFDSRIEKVMARLDDATNTLMDTITKNMLGLVDRYVLGPIISIADGITCGFLPTVYRDVVSGLCYQGVVGFRNIGKSYVVVALAVLFLAVVMYALWRRAIDNVNAESEKSGDPEASTVGASV